MQQPGDAPGEQWRLGRRPALDGVRGIAILLVLLSHFTHGRLSNFGSTGVTVFFALSGFLITAMLLDEGEQRGRISLSGFYGRRARRLLPALAVFLSVWVTLGALGVGPFRYDTGQVAGTVLYLGNWLMAAHAVVPQPLAITWSLSVEEQFYLLWPLVLLGGLRVRWLPMAAAALGAVAAVALRIAAWDGSEHTAWSIYYRTDTRMDSLLVGCLLAVAVKRWRVPGWARRLQLPGLALLALVLVTPSAWLHYVGEPLLAAAGTVLLIAASLATASRWLTWAPLRWFGRRSYALYLWHYPLIVLAWWGKIPMVLAIVLAVGCAEASWWLVERPLRRLGRPDGSVAESAPVAASGLAA